MERLWRSAGCNGFKRPCITEEFPAIVHGISIIEGKLRILLRDGSFMEVWLSVKRPGTYAYHWERHEVDGTIYRHNNLPDRQARNLTTYPRHFHDRRKEVIRESNISDVPEDALKEFLRFAQRVLGEQG